MGFLKKIDSFKEDEDQELKVHTPPSNFGDDYDDGFEKPKRSPPPPKKYSYT
jgi:hypothetical protein